MKRISHLLLLSIFLASCANTGTPIPKVTVTRFAEVTVTFTSVPTSTPTEVPATPTKTPDPNRPADATGQDKDGNYTKPWVHADGKPVLDAKGNQLYETWASIPAGPNGEMFNSWTEPHIKNPTFNGGIQLGDGNKKLVSVRFNVKEGMTAPFLSHTNDGPDSLFYKMFIL